MAKAEGDDEEGFAEEDSSEAGKGMALGLGYVYMEIMNECDGC